MNYIIAEIINNKFKCNLKAKFENTVDEDIDIDVIIDTGCTHSHISADLFTIFFSDSEKVNEKDKWIKKRTAGIGKGVESMNQVIDFTVHKNNPRVVVQHRFYDIKLNNIDIGNAYVNVSYDTHMVALIGMEFIKDIDIHIGISNKTGKYTLIACPKNKLNDEYYKALDEHFNLGNKILSATI